MSDRSALVVGGGLAGLSTALELAGRGWRADVFDAGPIGRGASWAAAGMLAAAKDCAPRVGRHPHLYELAQESRRLWPDWAARVARDSGQNLDLRLDGGLTPAFDAAGVADLDAFVAAARNAGASVERLDAAAARKKEPALAPDVAGAVFAPEEGHVDSRALVDALAACCRAAGVSLHADADVRAVTPGSPAGIEVVVGGDLHRLDADVVVLAAGWRTPAFGLGPKVIGPVKGQIFAIIDVPAGRPAHLIHAPLAYVVPRSNGRLLVGATEEAGRSDAGVDPVAIALLRAAAERALPGLALGQVESAWTGVRPGTPDGAPVLDWVADGVLMAAGHHRNGVLLAPASAGIVADLVDGRRGALAQHFSASRFMAEEAR